MQVSAAPMKAKNLFWLSTICTKFADVINLTDSFLAKETTEGVDSLLPTPLLGQKEEFLNNNGMGQLMVARELLVQAQKSDTSLERSLCCLWS